MVTLVRVGALTIGQAPRDDVMPELSRHLRYDVEIVQRGALDGLSLDQVREHAPMSGDSTLVSRMLDGTEVAIEKSFVVPRLQEQIRAFEEDEMRAILLLCTARFDGLQSRVTLLRPAQALERSVEKSRCRRLGVFTPAPGQIPAQRSRWRDYAPNGVCVEATSPYPDGSGIEDAAKKLLDADVDAAVMDCIGYTDKMRSLAQSILRVPVFSAVGALGGAAAELMDTKSS